MPADIAISEIVLDDLVELGPGDKAVVHGEVAGKLGLPGAEDPVDSRRLPAERHAMTGALEADTVDGDTQINGFGAGPSIVAARRPAVYGATRTATAPGSCVDARTGELQGWERPQAGRARCPGRQAEPPPGLAKPRSSRRFDSDDWAPPWLGPSAHRPLR